MNAQTETLKRGADAADEAAQALRDAAGDLKDETLPPDRHVGSPYRELVTACQWLIQQEFPEVSEQTREQRDLVEALQSCGERAGV